MHWFQYNSTLVVVHPGKMEAGSHIKQKLTKTEAGSQKQGLAEAVAVAEAVLAKPVAPGVAVLAEAVAVTVAAIGWEVGWAEWVISAHWEPHSSNRLAAVH